MTRNVSECPQLERLTPYEVKRAGLLLADDFYILTDLVLVEKRSTNWIDHKYLPVGPQESAYRVIALCKGFESWHKLIPYRTQC